MVVNHGCFTGLDYKRESDKFWEVKKEYDRKRKLGEVVVDDPLLEQGDPLVSSGAGAAFRLRRCFTNYFGYHLENTSLITDRQDSDKASADNILKAWNRVIKNAAAGDNVLLFFCGHGCDIDGESNDIEDFSLLCSGDTEIDGLDLLDTMEYASSCSVQLTVILDCCSGGGLFQRLANEQLPPFTDDYQLLIHDSAAIMISSCRKGQNSYVGSFNRKSVKLCSTKLSKSRPFDVVIKSSYFVEVFLKSAKKLHNGAGEDAPLIIDFMEEVDRKLKKESIALQQYNRKLRKNPFGQPQLYCSAIQAHSKFR